MLGSIAERDTRTRCEGKVPDEEHRIANGFRR
jgi:hypothetical protein